MSSEELTMRPFLIAVSALALLSGCATMEQEAARQEQEMGRMIYVYGPACQRLGFAPDTDQWRNCVIGLGQMDAMYYYGNSYYSGSPGWRYYGY